VILGTDGARFFVPNTKLASDTIRNATRGAPRPAAEGAGEA